MPPDNGWEQHKKLVTETLNRHGEELKELTRCVSKGFENLRVDIAVLKIRSSVYGFLAGGLAVLIAVGVTLLQR